MEKNLKSKILEYSFYAICLIIIFVLSLIYKSNIFELISTILGLCAVILNSKKEPKCFFIYIFYVSIYGVISFFRKQYGEAILNICYNLPMYLFTIYNLFIKKKKQKNETINNLKKKQLFIIIIFIIFFSILYSLFLNFIGSNLPYFNALATSFCIVSVYLASKMIKEQWIFWILYSIVLTYIWYSNYLIDGETGILYLVLNIIYIVLNIKGYITWIKIEKNKEYDL